MAEPKDNILKILACTRKKIDDIKSFNIPVVKRTIEEYEKVKVDQHFIEQQKSNLQKLYAMIEELEVKAERLKKRL